MDGKTLNKFRVLEDFIIQTAVPIEEENKIKNILIDIQCDLEKKDNDIFNLKCELEKIRIFNDKLRADKERFKAALYGALGED